MTFDLDEMLDEAVAEIEDNEDWSNRSANRGSSLATTILRDKVRERSGEQVENLQKDLDGARTTHNEVPYISSMVVSDDGDSLDALESFLRNALRLVDGLGYWSVAVAIILVRGDGKRLGDVVGHTLVVEEEDRPAHKSRRFPVPWVLFLR